MSLLWRRGKPHQRMGTTYLPAFSDSWLFYFSPYPSATFQVRKSTLFALHVHFGNVGFQSLSASQRFFEHCAFCVVHLFQRYGPFASFQTVWTPDQSGIYPQPFLAYRVAGHIRLIAIVKLFSIRF